MCKKNKTEATQTGRETVKLPLFTENNPMCENSKESTKHKNKI